MLYRFTLTLNLEEDKIEYIDKLKTFIKNEAEWIGSNVNVKVEDEYCIQANKKRSGFLKMPERLFLYLLLCGDSQVVLISNGVVCLL